MQSICNPGWPSSLYSSHLWVLPKSMTKRSSWSSSQRSTRSFKKNNKEMVSNHHEKNHRESKTEGQIRAAQRISKMTTLACMTSSCVGACDAASTGRVASNRSRNGPAASAWSFSAHWLLSLQHSWSSVICRFGVSGSQSLLLTTLKWTNWSMTWAESVSWISWTWRRRP